MAFRTVLHLLFVLELILKGLAALVQTQQTVVAVLEEEARLNCRVMQLKDVVQVTWQKRSHAGMKNVATYSKRFGPQVMDDFRANVKFKDSGVLNSSIIITNATVRDEGCYRCMFNTFPDGAFTATTCLHLFKLHEPVLHVRESNSTETVVSCSATGRPAPTVTLRVLTDNGHFSNYSSVSVDNTNSTVTVTTTAVMTHFHDDSTEVGCSAGVLSAPLKEVFLMIPAERQSSDDGVDGKSLSDNRYISLSVKVGCVFGAAAVCCSAAVVIFMLIYRHRKRCTTQRPGVNKTPEKAEHTHETKTSFVQQERQRKSAEKKEESDRLSASSAAEECKRQLF